MIGDVQNNGGYLNNPPTEIVEKVKENVILKNKDYEIVLIPNNMKIDNSDDSMVPRILYDNKSKKYCYQLDYNTYIFLDRSEYEEHEKNIEIKDNRLLFFKLEKGKLGGRGSDLSDVYHNYFELYSNYDEYVKKYGKQDEEGEFKKRGDEIKIYKNLEDYFKRKCRIYLNKKNFENNIYSEYEDIYYYYLPGYVEKETIKYNDLLNDSKEKLLKIEKNIEKFYEKYNSFFDIKREIYFDESHNLNLNGDMKRTEVISKIMENYIRSFCREDNGKYIDGTMVGTIYFITQDIEGLIKCVGDLKILKKITQMEIQNSTYYDLNKKPILELTKLKENFTFLWEKIFELEKKLKEILEKFIIFFEDVMKLPIFLNLKRHKIEKFNEKKDDIIRYMQSNITDRYFNNLLVDRDNAEIKKMADELHSYVEVLCDGLEKRLNSHFNLLILNRDYYEEIASKVTEVNNLYNEFKNRFYIEDKLNIPKNKNSLTDEEKKQLRVFISFMKKIVEIFNELIIELPNKIANVNQISDRDSQSLKESKKKLKDYLVDKICDMKSHCKTSKNILLMCLEEYLNLYKDLIIDDVIMAPEYKDLDSNEIYYEYHVSSLGNGYYAYVKPLLKEKLYDFFENVKKFIGEDKSSYENLYSLCDDLILKIQLKYAKRCYGDFNELLYEKNIENLIKENEDAKKRNDEENISYYLEQVKEQRERNKEYKHNILISLETIKNEIEIYRKLIKDVSEYSNKIEFLKKVKLLQIYVVPAVLEYDRFFVDFEKNKTISLYKKNVYDNFKNILIEILEDAIKKINGLYEVENKNKSIVKNIADNIESVAKYDVSFLGSPNEEFRKISYDKIIKTIDDSINKFDELKKTEVDEEYKKEIDELKLNLCNLKEGTESIRDWFANSDRPVILQNSFYHVCGKISNLFKIKNAGDSAIKKIKEDLLSLKGENK